MVKRLPVMRETQVQSLGQEDPLEEGMATYSGVLAWRIPWTEEPGGYSPWGHSQTWLSECHTSYFNYIWLDLEVPNLGLITFFWSIYLNDFFWEAGVGRASPSAHPWVSVKPCGSHCWSQGSRRCWTLEICEEMATQGEWVPMMALILAVQTISRVWLFATPQTAARQASLSFFIFWSLLKLMFIESVMPPNHLILCCPLLLLPLFFPSIRVFSNELVLCIRWPKYWSFSFSISPSNEYSGLISFRIDLFDLLAVQGTLKSLLQYHSSKASILVPHLKSINSSVFSLLYGPTSTSIHGYWKNHSFD